MSNEICHTCCQQIPEGYVPIQEASAIARALKVWGQSVFASDWTSVGENYSFYSDSPDEYPGYNGTDWEVPGIFGRVTQVDCWGGVDLGSDRGVVLKVSAPSGERYFVIPGHHQSHYGTEWYPDRIHEVVMHKIEKIEWRAV